MGELTKSLNMAKNYSRRLNIDVIGLAEDKEKDRQVEFFEFWLPDVLNMTSGLNWSKLIVPQP